MSGHPYKIAVAGTHSTGKSSFLIRLEEALKSRGVRVEHVHSGAVDAAAHGLPILTGHTFDSTAWIMAETMQSEALAALRAEVILIDRPTPDALGYLLAALRHTGGTLEPGRYARLEAICSAWAGEYDLVFLTRIDPAIPLGPGRDQDLVFRLEAANAVREIVDKLLPERQMLDSTSIDGSVEFAVNAFERWRQSC